MTLPPLIAREKIIPKSEEQTDFGYSIRMNITPSVLTMTLFFGEEVVYIARAKIKGNRQIDLAQAISYAAHMIYKFAEQKHLENGEVV